MATGYVSLAIVVFTIVAVAVFAFIAAAIAPKSFLGERLRALGSQPKVRENKPAIRDRIEQALDPLSKTIPPSPVEISRIRGQLIQAGFRDAVAVNYYFGARLLTPVAFLAIALGLGFDNPPLLIGVTALGFLLPRFILMRMIRRRQNRFD